jgi:hypothetical protein
MRATPAERGGMMRKDPMSLPMSQGFDAVLLSGHKQDAVELPFDPASAWNSIPEAIQPGRRGHRVRGTLNGVAFDSWVVSRSKRHFVLIEEPVRLDAGAAVGDAVHVVIAPAPQP